MKTAVIVWLMVSVVRGGNAYGPEFSTQEKCEIAAKQIQQHIIKVYDWNYSMPTCIRIEK
jgi:hypothetical protein